MIGGLRLALGLLTVIPAGRPDLGRGREAMVLAPLAVLPLALVAALAGWAGMLVGLPSVLGGVVVVALLALGTRAMHLDGLADTVDGLGSGKSAEQALEIMRRGDIGPMGVVALVLVLGAEVLASGLLLGRPWGWLELAVLIAASRAALALGCLTGIPAARPDGLGALVADRVPTWAASASWIVATAAAVASGVLSGGAWWVPLVAVFVAIGCCGWVLRLAVRRLGGITGDVLGCLVEVSAAMLLLVATIG